MLDFSDRVRWGQKWPMRGLDNWPIRGCGGQSIAKLRKYGDSGYRVETCSNAAFVGWHEHRIRMTVRPIIQLFLSVRSCSVFSSQSENFDSSGIFWVFVSLILLLGPSMFRIDVNRRQQPGDSFVVCSKDCLGSQNYPLNSNSNFHMIWAWIYEK